MHFGSTLRPLRRRRAAAAFAGAAVVLTLAACGSDYPLGEEQRHAAEANASDLSGTITGVGSSAQSAAMSTWISSFGALNPGVRSDDSGTTENFTDYLHATAPDTWTDEEDGSWPSGLGGENAQGNAGVMSTVTRTVGSIAYVDDSVAGKTAGKAKLKVGDEFVAVSAAAAALAVDAAEPAEGRGEHDFALKLDRGTTAPGAYPLVLVSYQIYCASYADPETVELVKAFGKYAVSDEGQQTAADSVGSAPMPDALAERANAAVESITTR